MGGRARGLWVRLRLWFVQEVWRSCRSAGGARVFLGVRISLHFGRLARPAWAGHRLGTHLDAATKGGARGSGSERSARIQRRLIVVCAAVAAAAGTALAGPVRY